MKARAWAGLLVATLAAHGCSAKETDAARPLATPGLTLAKPKAALGSPLEATYRFVVAADAPTFNQDYRVMVHFMDADGEMMWTDDHQPPTRTAQWKAGQTIEYTRLLFVPLYHYIGPATVRMGLYSVKDQTRLPLAGKDKGQRSYEVASLELLPQSENVFLIYKDGWHRAEVAQDNANVEWQWTKKDATLSFRNPRRDGTFYLQLDGRPDLFPEPQQVTLLVGGQALATFPLTSREQVIHQVPITAAQMGGGDMVEVTISVDKTFVPSGIQGSSSGDSRELGVRVFNAFVEPR